MLKKKRWQLVFLLFLAGVVNYLDRSALSVAAPLVSRDLGLGPADLGMIVSSFFFGYAIFNFIGGWASDRFGGKRVFTLAMSVWSAFCALTAAATGFMSLLAIRVCFGVGEGPLSATINKVVNNWFPHREAASAVGFANCGTPLGGAIAGPIVGLLAVAFGWRVSFVAIGVLGFVWLMFWIKFATETPREHPSISVEELQEIEGDHADPTAGLEKQPLGFYLRQPVVLATGLAFFGYNYILFFFLTWFPSYLTMAQHLSIKDMSIATVLPWVLGFCGLAAGGAVSDAVFRATGRALFARKLVLTVCLSVSAVCVALAGLVTTVGSALMLMSGAVFFLYLTGSTYWAILQDTVRGENIGGVGGFIHMIANCAGIIGPAVTGFIVQSTGVFTSAFVLAGGIAILGVVCVLVFVRPITPLAASGMRAPVAPAH
jgi:ACS family hexuronate transporter-like MFS transporter